MWVVRITAGALHGSSLACQVKAVDFAELFPCTKLWLADLTAL